MKWDSIPASSYYDAILPAYRNAEDFLYEAELLLRLGSYGHSLALSVLGIEEVSKSAGYFILAIESIKPDWIWGLTEEEPQVIFDNLHRNHYFKHKLIFNMASFIHFGIDELHKEFPPDRDYLILDLPKEERETKNARVIKRIEKKLKHTITWERDMEFFKIMDERKKVGLYVDTRRGTKTETPKSIGKNDANKALKMLRKYLDGFEFLIQIRWDAEEIERLRAIKLPPDMRMEISEEELEYLKRYINQKSDEFTTGEIDK